MGQVLKGQTVECTEAARPFQNRECEPAVRIICRDILVCVVPVPKAALITLWDEFEQLYNPRASSSGVFGPLSHQCRCVISFGIPGFGLTLENLAMLFDTQGLQKHGIEYGDGIKCFEAFDTDDVRDSGGRL